MFHDGHRKASQEVAFIQKGQPGAAFYLEKQKPADGRGGKGGNEQTCYPQVQYTLHAP